VSSHEALSRLQLCHLKAQGIAGRLEDALLEVQNLNNTYFGLIFIGCYLRIAGV